MAEPLKAMFDTGFVPRLAAALHGVEPRFAMAPFVDAVFDAAWPALELKARMRRISVCLGEHLPGRYRRQLDALCRVAPQFSGFTAMVFPDFVEVYGTGDADASLPALELFTRYSSAEFAIRPFILQDERGTMAWMLRWAASDNEHVRRLASEGCRPRLPWATALPRFKQDPAPILPILERLKADASPYVRRSVANNLNDIAKDHPALVRRIAAGWLGQHPDTDALVRHACRTLLKSGDVPTLALFGLSDRVRADVEALAVSRERLRIGETLEFRFVVVNSGRTALRCRVEYHLHFARPSGKPSRKVFQVGERTLAPGRHEFSRRYAFVDRTTRRHHPGPHTIAIALNGVAKAAATVRLTA